MFFSIIIPVYNRPDEIEVLVQSLRKQTYKDFEVILVEDGSSLSCKHVFEKHRLHLQLFYLEQKNSGQGFARNLGIRKSKGDYFVFFDSDCQVPAGYLESLKNAIQSRKLDAHGGPDDAAEAFSPWQKAMNFSMTSLWTTGGIRGNVKDPSRYQARGFNMGFSKEVYQQIGGFIHPNMAEDIEISMRIKKAGFKLELVKEAFVYHRRKNDFFSFIRQGFQFGRNRVFIRRYHPEAVKWVHLLPLLFLLGVLFLPLAVIFSPIIAGIFLMVYVVWTVLVFIAGATQYRSLLVGSLAILTSYGQLFGYGAGVLMEFAKPGK
ncbi:MAG: glycosyltransferase [Cyclobacteriaceae bacterium]